MHNSKSAFLHIAFVQVSSFKISHWTLGDFFYANVKNRRKTTYPLKCKIYLIFLSCTLLHPSWVSEVHARTKPCGMCTLSMLYACSPWIVTFNISLLLKRVFLIVASELLVVLSPNDQLSSSCSALLKCSRLD
jgi:hypothetical protein